MNIQDILLAKVKRENPNVDYSQEYIKDGTNFRINCTGFFSISELLEKIEHLKHANSQNS